MILINTVMIGLLWNKKDSRNKRQRSRNEVNEFVIRELGFDDQQAKIFNELAQKHYRVQRQNQKEFRQRKLKINERLMNGETFDIDSAADVLAEVTSVKEREFYRFFNSVLEICDEEQKQRLQKVFFEAAGPPDYANMPFQNSSKRKRHSN